MASLEPMRTTRVRANHLPTILLGFAALLAAGCAEERAGGPAGVPPAATPAAGAAAPAVVSGLTLPLQGERFRIGDEMWIVEAATVELATHGVQEDTQIVDVTIQARRAGAEPPEYLGEDPAPSQPPAP
jgi:hypothetical protein